MSALCDKFAIMRPGRVAHLNTIVYRYCLAWLLLSAYNGVTAIKDVAPLLSSKGYNVDYDWSSSIIAAGCTLAKRPDYRPPPSCPEPAKSVDRETASKLGWKFAPILYQHPLDTSWLTDPARWLNESTSYNIRTWQKVPHNDVEVPEGAAANNASQEYLSSQNWFATRLVVPSFNTTTRKVTFTVDDGATILRKAVIDPVVNGTLTGKVWFTAFRPFNPDTGETIPHAYVFTYLYYYPWNGCSNQVLGTQVSGRKQGVEYYMCPDGIHEGDLEHVKVYVCEADLLTSDPSSAVQRIQLSQHGWLPELDCKAGECKFEEDRKGQRRLVVMAALFAHANWVSETPLYLYAKVRLSFLLNMDGLYIGDRYKKGPVFYPDETNIRFLPYLSEMTEEQKLGEMSWATFPGVWGATLKKSGRRTITCLKDNFTSVGPCTTKNPAYFILDYILRPRSWKEEDMEYTAETSGNTVSGPLFRRVFSYNWEVERESPLYTIKGNQAVNLTFDGYCPLEGPLQDTAAGLASFHRISLRHYLGALTGLVLGSSIITFAMVLPVLLVRGEKKVLRELAEEGDKDAGQEAEGKANQEGRKVVSETALTSSGASSPSDGAVGPPALAASPSDPGPGLKAAIPEATSRLSLLMDAHQAILRVFQASVMQPSFLIAWIAVGIVLYICGLVLAAIGIAECVTALDRIAPLRIWDVLGHAVVAAFIVFGVIHLAVIITSLWILPVANRFFKWGPRAMQAGMRTVRQSWKAHAVLSGLLVIEMAVTMLMFAFGLMMWVVRYGVTEICVAAITSVFNGIEFVADICVDLSIIGLSDSICGSDLSNLCGIWAGLNVDYLSFGCLLFLMAESMFLVLATTNYVAMRSGAAISAVMQQTETNVAKSAGRHDSGSTFSVLIYGLTAGQMARRKNRRQHGMEAAAAPGQPGTKAAAGTAGMADDGEKAGTRDMELAAGNTPLIGKGEDTV